MGWMGRTGGTEKTMFVLPLLPLLPLLPVLPIQPVPPFLPVPPRVTMKLEVGMKQSIVRRLALVAAAFAFVALLSALPLSAHHGWGGYVEQLSDLSGTVTAPVSLVGPHATMKVSAEGHVWDVVLAPPPRAAQAGLKDGMIPVGEKVVVHGQRHRDANKFEIKTTRLTWNRKVFNVYPDRD
jgi:hypothetical protein